MQLGARAIRTAVARHVSADLAKALELPEQVDVDDVGAVLRRALMGGDSKDLDLVDAILSGPATLVTLAPWQIEAHPLLSHCVAGALSDALGTPFAIGAVEVPLFGMVTLPTIDAVTITETGDGLWQGCAILKWPHEQGEVMVASTYGARRLGGAHMRSHTLSGEALRCAGRTARQLTFGSSAGDRTELAMPSAAVH